MFGAQILSDCIVPEDRSRYRFLGACIASEVFHPEKFVPVLRIRIQTHIGAAVGENPRDEPAQSLDGRFRSYRPLERPSVVLGERPHQLLLWPSVQPVFLEHTKPQICGSNFQIVFVNFSSVQFDAPR